MGQSIAKLNIMLGVDTSGIISGIDGKAIPKIREFKNTVDSISAGGGAGGASTMAAGFKTAAISLKAMEGSLSGMGASMGALISGGPVLIGIAAEVAALYGMAKFSAWGIKMALGQDAEFTGKWKVFKDEIADLALKIGELFMPLIKWWLDVGIAAVRALKGGTVAEAGTYDRLNPTGAEAKVKAAKETLEIEDHLLEKYRQQHKQIEETAKRRREEAQRHVDELTKSLRTPAEVLQDSVTELNKLMNENLITFGTYSRGIEKAAADYADLVDKAKTLKEIHKGTRNPTALERGSSAELTARNKIESITQAMADTAKQQLAVQRQQAETEKQIKRILETNNVTFQPINLR